MRLALLACILLSTTACATAPDPVDVEQPSDKIAVCGGFAGKACPEGHWCDYPAGSPCGAIDQQGTCHPRPEVCTKIYKPVCGCDGRTYGNACEAQGRGTDVRKEGEC